MPFAELAPYAVADGASRGRAHPENLPAGEPPFEIDRGRIVTCMSFRRLMHKTQVFVTDSGDHFRTRLTHTLEVAAQAQRLARALRLNERLAEVVALAHDLGHPPFGHAGEKALAELMAEHGGFEHNRQSLHLVDYLEHPYPAFRGLNLSFEVRESLIKHHTLYDCPQTGGDLDEQTRSLTEAGPSPPLEGQAANLADAVAYTLHDIEDGLGECGLTEEALDRCVIWRRAAEAVRRQYPALSVHAVRRPILDAIAPALIADAAVETQRRIDAAGVGSPDDVRRHPADLVAFSDEAAAALSELQALLVEAVYRHHRVVRMDSKARRLVRELFAAFLAEPELLPGRYSARLAEQGAHRVICDYIAGMTDRFCQQEYRRLFGPFKFG